VKSSFFHYFGASGFAESTFWLFGLPVTLAALTLCASTAYGQGGSRMWTGAVNGDYYNVGNWSPSGNFPNGNATFSGTVPNSTITKTGNSYEYIFGLIFGNTLSTQSSFTFSPGGTRFFVGGSSISTAAVTSGRLTDEIGVDVYLANAATAFDIGSNHDLKISGNVTGSGATVTKNGAGTLILSGTNTYAATTTAAAGTLLATRAVSLAGYNSAGKVIFNGGTIGAQLGGSGWTTTEVDTLLGNATKTNGTLGIDTTNGNLTQWTPFTAGSFGALGLTKLGTNTLTLDQANTYTGTTSVTEGTLSLTGSLTGGGAISTSGTSVFSQSSTGGISGASSFTHGSSGTSILAGSNTYSGITNLTSGTLQIKNNTALGTTAGNTIVATNAKLHLDGSAGNLTIAEPLTLGGGEGVIRNLSGNNTITGLVTLSSVVDLRRNSGSLTLSGGVTSGAASHGLGLNLRAIVNTNPISINNGTLTLTSNGGSSDATEINVAGNTWGTTLINFGGYLKTGVVDALPSTTNVEFGWSLQSFSTGTLDLNGFDQTVASIGINSNSVGLGGNQNITGGGTLTVNLASGTKTYEGRITDGTTATALVKNGNGTQILKNLSGIDNNYSGGTTINGGTLLVNNTSGSGTGTGTVTVAAGGTLGGTGSVIGGINVSGILAPGNSIESLGTGALSFTTGSTYAYELSTIGLNGDLTFSSGTLNIATGTILTLNDLSASTALANGSKLTLISSGEAWNGGLFTYGGTPLADDSNITLGANIWKFNYNDNAAGSNFTGDITGATSFVTMTVVPEPNSATLLGGLCTLLLLRRRRSGAEINHPSKRGVCSSQ
jgi:autotransporter-associated beta strand protein